MGIENRWSGSFTPVFSPLPLPDRTSWGTNATYRERCQDGGLNDCLTRLVKLHHWLTVKSAPDQGRFPFEFAFKREKGDDCRRKGLLKKVSIVSC